MRWRFVPQDGEKALTDAELSSMPKDFLEPALIDWTRQGPVRWEMLLTIGEPGDPEDDPTLAWPKDRREGRDPDDLVRDGPAGRGLREDQLRSPRHGRRHRADVLLFRSPSYGVSYSRRLQGR